MSRSIYGRARFGFSLFLVLFVILSGCQKSDERLVNEKGIAFVSDEDEDMNLAMKKARESFSEFVTATTSDESVESAMVKAYFTDPDVENGEHMWVDGVTFDGTNISGTLVSTPGFFTSVSTGDQVSFTIEKLSDWLYAVNGKAKGAFTVNLLRNKMSDEERTDHDSYYPFSFD